MSEPDKTSPIMRILTVTIVICAVAVGTWWFVTNPNIWPRSGALQAALVTMHDAQPSDRSVVATAILDNFLETRRSAAMWSGVYWGCTFVAALLSALAALTLKLETFIRNEGARKDLAAAFSIIAALLVTISTSGDFQRKWQANRIAAAELEKIGYEFLEANGDHARSYLAEVGNILLRRQMAIVGGIDQGKLVPASASTEGQGTQK